MARSDDEPGLGEIKGLLRRLEGGALQGDETPLRRLEADPHEDQGWAGASQRRPSSAAVLILIANTVMATATITSIAWYFFHAAAIQKSAQLEGEPERKPAVHERQELSPSQAAAPTTEHPAAVPSGTAASPPAGERSPSERSGTDDSAQGAASIAASEPAAALEQAQKTPESAGAMIAHEEPSQPPPLADLTPGASGSESPDAAAPGASEPVREGTTRMSLVEKARELLAFGQIAAARLLLQRAAEGNDAEGALLLAETFDPAHASFPGVSAEAEDREAARMWYERAAALGSSEARARVSGLKPN